MLKGMNDYVMAEKGYTRKYDGRRNKGTKEGRME